MIGRCRCCRRWAARSSWSARSASGHAVKALNNLLAATAFVATSEVFAVGAKFGLDPSTMLKVVNASSGQNFQTTHVWEKAVIERTF